MVRTFEYGYWDDFVKSIPLQQLSSNFRTVELVGARLNTCSEVDNFKLNDTYMIKTLSSGGDRINCDVKNGKPIDFVNLAALVFASNEIEGLRQFSNNNALYERLIIIPFLNSIEKKSKIFNITNKLQEELPYIIKKFALPGLNRLFKNYWNFTDAEYISRTKKELFTTQNSVYKFLEEYCEFGEEYRMSSVELYTAYRRYCQSRELECMTKSKFLENVDIADTYFDLCHVITRKRVRIEDENIQGYMGIRLK